MLEVGRIDLSDAQEWMAYRGMLDAASGEDISAYQEDADTVYGNSYLLGYAFEKESNLLLETSELVFDAKVVNWDDLKGYGDLEIDDPIFSQKQDFSYTSLTNYEAVLSAGSRCKVYMRHSPTGLEILRIVPLQPNSLPD